jgi:hypothetical protein
MSRQRADGLDARNAIIACVRRYEIFFLLTGNIEPDEFPARIWGTACHFEGDGFTRFNGSGNNRRAYFHRSDGQVLSRLATTLRYQNGTEQKNENIPELRVDFQLYIFPGQALKPSWVARTGGR